jgi:hypothetical protein
MDRSINQSTNQAINRSINQSINQSTNQPTNQPTKQPINQSSNQAIKQATNKHKNQSDHTVRCNDAVLCSFLSLFGRLDTHCNQPDVWNLDRRRRDCMHASRQSKRADFLNLSSPLLSLSARSATVFFFRDKSTVG